MAFSPFQTCWDRVDRAEIHRKASIDIWNALLDDHVYQSWGEIDSDGNGRYFLNTVQRDWILPVSFELGELLYQLRGAIDSCVYDAAVLKFGQNPPPDEEKWNFPLTSNPKDFENAVRRMKNLPADIRGLMEGVQGYSGSTCRHEGKEWDHGTTLAILNDWARIDRHRKLNLVGTALMGGNLVIAHPVEMGVEYCTFIGGDILENQSEVARFKISNYASGSEIHLNPQFALEIMVDETPRVRLQEISLAMMLSVVAVREMFEKHFAITR